MINVGQNETQKLSVQISNIPKTFHQVPKKYLLDKYLIICKSFISLIPPVFL